MFRFPLILRPESRTFPQSLEAIRKVTRIPNDPFDGVVRRPAAVGLRIMRARACVVLSEVLGREEEQARRQLRTNRIAAFPLRSYLPGNPKVLSFANRE